MPKEKKTEDDTNPSRQFQNFLTESRKSALPIENLHADANIFPACAETDLADRDFEFDSGFLAQCMNALVLPSEYEDDEARVASDDEDSEDEAAKPSMDTLDDELLVLFLLHNLSHRAMQFLLNALHSRGLPVSKSLYLLTTKDGKKKVLKYPMGTGDFAYLGIASNIGYLLSKNLLRLGQASTLPNGSKGFEVDIKIGIDGMPVYRASNYSAWPILALISGFDRPVPIGLFAGIGKPPLEDYIAEFCKEAAELMSDFKMIEGVNIKIRKLDFICDAPARSFICKTLGHNSHAGCFYCRSIGKTVDRRVVYPTTAGESRTAEDYRTGSESNQRAGPSPLMQLPGLEFPQCIPPDYMHLVCLGTVRKLFHFLFATDDGRHCKLRPSDIAALSDEVQKVAPFTPSEFQRRPRRIDRELSHFKASELKNFVLYFGPVIFRRFLPVLLYKNFLLLHFAIYVFMTPELLSHPEIFRYAAAALTMFVSDAHKLYGNSVMSHNTHVLLHLPEFVRSFGSLSNFCAFPFENYLSHIKKRLRVTRFTTAHLLAQMLNVREMLTTNPASSLRYSPKPPNNCCVIGDNIVRISAVHGNGEVTGVILQFNGGLYEYPYTSELLRIGYYCDSRQTITGMPKKKCIMLPQPIGCLVVPLVSEDLH